MSQLILQGNLQCSRLEQENFLPNYATLVWQLQPAPSEPRLQLISVYVDVEEDFPPHLAQKSLAGARLASSS